MCKEKYINPTDMSREAEIQAYNEKERMAYEQSLKAYRDYTNTISSAEYMGEKRGIEKGRAEGREEGREEGITLVAKKMKESGISVEQIMELTSLTQAQIEEL